MARNERNKGLAKQVSTHRVPVSSTMTAIQHFLSALDCPRSLAVWLLYVNGEHEQLVDLDCHPHRYAGERDFRDAYAATELLSKANFLNLKVDRKEAAMAKFFKFEEQCRRTNIRFSSAEVGSQQRGPTVWLLNATIRKISQILGDFSPEEFVDEANWGPGVTTLLKGEHVSATNKFHDERGITRGLYSLVKPWFAHAYPAWTKHLTRQSAVETRYVTLAFSNFHGLSENLDVELYLMPEVSIFKLVERSEEFKLTSLEGFMKFEVGNQVVTVPKTAKIDRVIAIEPGINLWFQKAIGSMIHKRLTRVGIDIRRGQERHRKLSRVASLTDTLATIDFSSASDSISRSVVEVLLPPRWVALMDACRSHFGLIDGKHHEWSKFSSMGNGFTFELETLIFYAAAKAVTEFQTQGGAVSVYGDDVILPSASSQVFSSYCEFLGFTVNVRKSFSFGPFRESCGAHWYEGADVQPIYLEDRLRRVPDLYRFGNAVRRFSHRQLAYYGWFTRDRWACDKRFRKTFYYLISLCPKPLRFRVSEGYGDSGFIANFDEASPSVARFGIEGYLVKSLLEIGKTNQFSETGLLLARLKVASVEEFGNYYALRGRTHYRVKTVLCGQWYDLGPWV